jgi:hypothetical protein
MVLLLVSVLFTSLCISCQLQYHSGLKRLKELGSIIRRRDLSKRNLTYITTFA